MPDAERARLGICGATLRKRPGRYCQKPPDRRSPNGRCFHHCGGNLTAVGSSAPKGEVKNFVAKVDALATDILLDTDGLRWGIATLKAAAEQKLEEIEAGGLDDDEAQRQHREFLAIVSQHQKHLEKAVELEQKSARFMSAKDLKIVVDRILLFVEQEGGDDVATRVRHRLNMELG